MPSLTKHIENGMKTVCRFRPAKWPVLAHATLGDEPASDDPFVISKLHHIEVDFNGVPMRLKRWIAREFRFDAIVIVPCSDQRFRCHAEPSARVRKLRVGSDDSAATEANR